MLIGCGDCEPAESCEFKVLVAVITPAGYTDSGHPSTNNPTTSPTVQGDCDNYCPNVYTASGGPSDCVWNSGCSAFTNIVAWLLGQYSAFQTDATYPWNTFTTAFFQDGSSGSPYATIGPQSTSIGFGASSYGSLFSVGSPTIANTGPTAGSVCAFAQLVAMRMSGNLFITPSDITGVTEACLWTPVDGVCSASGEIGSGTYYIPMPPLDLCTDTNYAGCAYVPGQTGNSDDCLPGFNVANPYTDCASPDPFFGDDPP